MDSILRTIKKIIPTSLFEAVQPIYHYCLAFLAAFIYRFPSRQIKVIFITGTKGKSSTTEILNAVLEGAGKKTAALGTIRFKIGNQSWPNLYKMTVPGRFFVQKFLRQAVNAGCEYAVVEMTSQAAIQYRHKFIDPDALLFLNISPEHIESHGSFENYLAAKVSLATALERSSKKDRLLVVNGDDPHASDFIAAVSSAALPKVAARGTTENSVTVKKSSLKDAEPYILDHYGLYLTFAGKNLRSHLQGIFNVYNILAALTYAATQNVTPDQMQIGLENLTGILGRVQKIVLPENNPEAKKQNFTVVVDYAHTADSLEKVYSVFSDTRKICVLGNTGGGRDKWKRPAMAKVANDNCSHIILTNEDPYDEDPRAIINEMIPGITGTPYEVIMNRREAIRKAISMAKKDDAVLITGKGTDPYIMEENGIKTPWSDARVAEEELEAILAKH